MGAEGIAQRGINHAVLRHAGEPRKLRGGDVRLQVGAVVLGIGDADVGAGQGFFQLGLEGLGELAHGGLCRPGRPGRKEKNGGRGLCGKGGMCKVYGLNDGVGTIPMRGEVISSLLARLCGLEVSVQTTGWGWNGI